MSCLRYHRLNQACFLLQRPISEPAIRKCVDILSFFSSIDDLPIFRPSSRRTSSSSSSITTPPPAPKPKKQRSPSPTSSSSESTASAKRQRAIEANRRNELEIYEKRLESLETKLQQLTDRGEMNVDKRNVSMNLLVRSAQGQVVPEPPKEIKKIPVVKPSRDSSISEEIPESRRSSRLFIERQKSFLAIVSSRVLVQPFTRSHVKHMMRPVTSKRKCSSRSKSKNDK